MDKYKKLFTNSGLFMIANFGSKVLSFLLIRFYTEVLSTAEYGTVDVVNTTAGFAFPIITLCITDAVLRFSIDERQNRQHIFSTGLAITLIGNLFFLLVSPLLSYFSFFSQNIEMIYLVTFSNSFYMLFAHFARGIGKSKLFAGSGLLHAAVQIGLNLLFLLSFKWGVKGYLLAIILSNIITGLFVFLKGQLYRYFTLKINKKYALSMLVYAIPLIPNSIFWWIMQSADRYAILYFLSSSENGLYSVANKTPSIIATLSTIFFQAWQISSVDEAQSADKETFYSKVFLGGATALTLFTSGLIAIIQPIFRIIADVSYFDGWQSAPFLMLAIVFSCYSSFLGTNYTTMKKTKSVFLTTVIGATINVVLNIVLTPVIGIVGTALATFVSFFVTWMIRAIDTRKYVEISYPFFKFIVPTSVIIIQAIIMTLGYSLLWLQLLFPIILCFLYWGWIKDAGKLILKMILRRRSTSSDKYSG